MKSCLALIYMMEWRFNPAHTPLSHLPRVMNYSGETLITAPGGLACLLNFLPPARQEQARKPVVQERHLGSG